MTSAARTAKIAFLGTGMMGEPMARNLLTAGFEVRVWNRTRSKAEPLAADGAIVTDTPHEAASGADILVTMLLDSSATVEAARPAMPGLGQGALWLQMGTIGLSGAEEVAALAVEHGMRLVDAPVLGTRAPAEQGTLVVLASGPEQDRDQAQPVFDAVGQRTLWVGADTSHGTRVKLVVNNWVLALTNAVGESIALAETLGVNPQLFLDAIKGTGTDSPYAHLKGAAILNEQWTPSFTLSAAHKDAQLISDAAGRLHLDLAEAARERLRRAADTGHGDKDMAAVYFSSFPEG